MNDGGNENWLVLARALGEMSKEELESFLSSLDDEALAAFKHGVSFGHMAAEYELWWREHGEQPPSRGSS